MYIIPANEMHTLTPDEELNQVCEAIMHSISKASQQGYYRTTFDVYPDYLYEAVKAEFAAKGYTFAPIGIVGGVRQVGEYICW